MRFKDSIKKSPPVHPRDPPRPEMMTSVAKALASMEATRLSRSTIGGDKLTSPYKGYPKTSHRTPPSAAAGAHSPGWWHNDALAIKLELCQPSKASTKKWEDMGSIR